MFYSCFMYLANIHPRWFLGIFIGFAVFSYFYIKIVYPFWNTQPVYHPYDFWRRFASSPFIIQKNFPMKNKFCDFENVKTYDYLDIQDNLQEIVDLVVSHYIPSDNVLFTVTKKHFNNYFTGQNNSSMFSLYYEKKYNYGEPGQTLLCSKIPVGLMTSRAITIFVRHKMMYIKYPCYFWDYLCVHREHRPKKISRNIIQTHEYNQRIKNPGVLISLFKKEGELSKGIVPLVLYNSYTFQIPMIKMNALPEHCIIVKTNKTNFTDFTDFLYKFLKNSKVFHFVSIPELGSLKNLIESDNLYVYLLKKREHVLGMYIFKDAKIQYENDSSCLIQCIGSILNCNNLDIFYNGFLHSLYNITWKTGYKNVLFENIADNAHIWEFFKYAVQDGMPEKNAYYLYNFVVPGSPLPAKNVLFLL